MAGADGLELQKREGVLDVNREGLLTGKWKGVLDVNGEGFLFILCGNKRGLPCVELLGKERGVWEECVKILGGFVKILRGFGAILEIGEGARPKLYKMLGG